MSDSPDALAQQIAALQAALQLPLPAESRRQLMEMLQALQAAATIAGDVVAGNKIVAPHGTVDVSGTAQIAVGINLGRIIYGRDPHEDERRLLGSYLARLSAALYRLPLRGLENRLDQGAGVALPQVYVTLATRSLVVLASGGSKELRRYFQDGKLDLPLKEHYDPNHAPPDRAIVQILTVEPGAASGKRRREERMLGRALLATEAVNQRDRLVLLGDPGSGKSTFLRHLAWALAQHGLDQRSAATALVGWDAQPRALPVVVSLRALAGRLAATKMPETEVFAALCAALAGYDIAQADELLNPALDRGAALILFDGLDEIPLDAVAGQVADRAATLRAVRAFAQKHARARFVITCRTRAFTEDFSELLGWHVETIAPFTLGQIRQFIPAWYGELVAKHQVAREQAGRLGQQLLDSILARPKLRGMADTPLLLTLMALVLFNNNELPRDRPQLYERILELLLGQWDQVRDGQSLGESIGLPDWDSERLRPLLDQLSYTAHLQARSDDGRGRLARRDVREALERFLRMAGLRGDQAAATAVRCLDYFEQRSGLLAPDASDDYSFAHLTLQEHCAGRALVLDPDAAGLIMRHRADDRWREPIFLGLGVAQKSNPVLLDRVLSDLVDAEEVGSAKPPDRRYRDLILAAEIGADRDWGYLRTQRVSVDRLQRDLKRGIVALLADTSQPLPIAERVRAGDLVGQLGDPRFPVTIDAWRIGLGQRSEDFGHPAGYWCYVRPGTYRIGGWQGREKAANITLSACWIARYPITVAQYAPFITAGYSKQAEPWWTPNGWRWKGDRTQPYAWNLLPYDGPNQPVIGVSWYEATAYCAWLTEQLTAALPEGYIARLPTEAEWEAAAAFDAAMQRRPYPWGDEEPTPERAIYDVSNLHFPVPVGCCPAGAAACGALDMAGNVWELTASSYWGYPEHSGEVIQDFANDAWNMPWRGGSFYRNSTFLCCGARFRDHPDDPFVNASGFRVVVAPRSY